MDGSDFDLDTDFDAIGLVHCLYLNSIDGQIEILKRCKKNLKPDGQLIIHALDVTRPGTELTMKLFFNLIKLIGRILGRTTTSSKLLIGIRQEGPWNWRRKELASLMAKHGFVVKDMEVHNRRIFYPYFILNCILKK